MPARSLPVDPHPPIVGRLRHAHLLSILGVEPEYHRWLHARYAQLFWPAARGRESALDFFYPPHYPSLPQLDVQVLDRKWVEGDLARPGSSWLRQAIDQDCYVVLYVDEARIPGAAGFGREGFPHRMLLHGYETEAACWHGLGFRKDGTYGALRIRYHDLAAACGTLCVLGQARDARSGERPATLGRPDRIWLGRRRHGPPFRFDGRLLREELADYLEGRDSSLRFRWQDRGYYRQLCAGRDIYPALQQRLEEAREGAPLPMLSLHVLWEHKRCMGERLRFLRRCGGLRFDGMEKGQKRLERAAWQARLVALRGMRAGDGPSRVSFIAERLERIRREELPLLEELLGILDRLDL